MTSGPVVVSVLEGGRRLFFVTANLMGATNPKKATAGIYVAFRFTQNIIRC